MMKDKSTLENIILNEFPYPIAVRYQRMLEAGSFEIKARRCIDIYEAGLRALTLGILGQYIQSDSKVVNDAILNKVALRLIDINRPPSLGTWVQVFFAVLKAYQGHRDRFFMTELYDFYWDTSVDPHSPHKGVQRPFQKLVELRNEISHAPPTDSTAWRSLFEEIDGYLHEILNRFVFLVNYDLVYIVEQIEDGYIYDVYTGQRVNRADLSQVEKSLKKGWCYLSKTTGQLLPVHPLIIFWEDELSQDSRRIEPEIVVYDSYRIQQLKYWHSSAGRLETQNPDLLDLFIALIVERLQAQRPQREVYRLSWQDFKVLSDQIVFQRMGDAQGKYNARLYLQREETRETFDEFLQSDKSCLVLTGSSGVGKSNFLLSLVDEFQESREVCTLAYNGARLDSKIPLEDLLARDFNYHLKLKGQKEPDGPAVLKMIDEIEEMKEKRVLIFVDALNENPDGKELLRHIDRFVENYPYPWLKVVITSRPEAWRTIKRGVRLAEHRYFRQRGEDELGIELTGFTYAGYEVRVVPFAYEELPSVYEKYREVYSLGTKYEDIPASIKRLLRDPLTLLLVAEIYHGDAIPQDIRASKLIEKYVKMLVKTERLNETDLYFLQHEIVPRLFRPPFPPILQPSDIENELTANGRSLDELIFNDDLLLSGRRVNQSYTMLADSAILLEQGPQLEQIIGFKYERFYEYFGGVYISQAADETDNPLEYYKALSSILNEKPYLWGALKNAFFTELENGNSYLIHELARIVSSSDRLLRSAIVSSLIEYSEIDLGTVTSLTNGMIQPIYGPANSIIETTKRLLFRKRYDAEPLKPEQAIAIEIAGRLRFEKLLTEAASDRMKSIRQAAILHIFYLWRNENEVGYRIMHQLGEYAVAGWDLPDLGAIDALTSLVISLITYDHRNPEVQKNALLVARRVLRKLLFLNSEEYRSTIGQVRFLIWSQIRRPLLSFAINWGLKIIASWEADDLPANSKTLSNFFAMSEDDKEFATLLVPFIDPYKPGLSKYVKEIMVVEEMGDLIAMNIAQQAPLIARAQVNFDDALTTLHEIIDDRLNRDQQIPWIDAYPWLCLQIALRQTTPYPELFKLAERCVVSIQSDPRGWLASHKTLPVPWLNTLATGIASHMILNHLYNGTSVSQLLEGWINRAIEDEDIAYLCDYLRELTVAFEMGFHQVALQGLQLMAQYDHPQIRQIIAELLIRIRHYYPEDVENILLQELFSKDINQLVWASSSSERVNDLLGIRAVGILYDIFLLGPEVLRRETIWLAGQAQRMPDLENWIMLMIKEVLNLAVNEIIFPVPEDSPSKLLLVP